MTDKRNEIEDDDFDLEKDFGIHESELKDLISMKEKGNLHILRHKIKPIDDGLAKVEEGLYDILYAIDEIMEDFESGKIFARDAGEAIEHLFTLASFTHKLEAEFSKLEELKSKI